jgi:hypothetical protein
MNPGTEPTRPAPSATTSSADSQYPHVFCIESRRESLWLIGGSLAFALIFFFPVLYNSRYIGTDFGQWLNRWPDLSNFSAPPSDGDRDLFEQMRWVPYYTLSHFHQVPFWNPYRCGGMSMLGNPESGIVTPFIALYFLFGLMPGMILEIYLHLALAFAGGYVLGRELGLKPLPSIVLAAIFPSSSWLPLHIGGGAHLNFLPAAYFAWILALLLSTCRTRRWFPAALSGLVCALTLTEGNYTFLYAALLVAMFALAISVLRLSIRPLLAAGVIGAFAVGFASLKLIPVAGWMAIHPRDYGASWIWVSDALKSIFSRNQDVFRTPTGPVQFTEFGGYISAPFALLAIVGIIAGGSDIVVWVIGAIFFFMLFLGDYGPHALITYVHLIPLGRNLGLCGRWVIPLVFCIGVLAAIGAQALCDRFRVWGMRSVAVLLAIGLIDAWIVCSPNYRYLFPYNEVSFLQSRTFQQFWFPSRGCMTCISLANMGALNCEGVGYLVPRGDVLGYNEPSYKGDAYLLGAGQVTQILWTPNKLAYDVDVPAATSLVVNQNLAPGWHLARGQGSIYSEGTLMAVHIPAGHYRIELAYQPPHIWIAVGLTLVAFIGLIAIWLFERVSPEAAGDSRMMDAM